MNAISKDRLGVLGGMGPLATADFLGKLVAATPAQCDQDHIPVVVYSVPQIPERPAAILDGGESPLPAMLEGIRTLKGAGATCIAIACNTAHYWYDDLAREGGLPILHIADAAAHALERRGLGNATIGLMATKGTIAAGFLQQRLAARGMACVVNTPEEQDELVLAAIAAVKGNDLDTAAALAARAARRLLERGASRVVLGCTELPVAIDRADAALRSRCLDATQALAEACVEWWHTRPRNV